MTRPGRSICSMRCRCCRTSRSTGRHCAGWMQRRSPHRPRSLPAPGPMMPPCGIRSAKPSGLPGRRILGTASYAANLPWDQTQGDLLNALQLLFQIQRTPEVQAAHGVAGRQYHAASTGRHGAGLAGRRRVTRKGRLAAPAPSGAAAAEPLVFLLPGVLGDEPLLAQFRVALGAGVRLRVIEYPDWNQTFATGTGLSPIIEAVLARVLTARRADLSARRLLLRRRDRLRSCPASGRGRAQGGFPRAARRSALGHHPAPRNAIPPQTGGRVNHLSSAAVRALIVQLVQKRCWRTLDRMKRLVDRHSDRLAFVFTRRLMQEVRQRALLEWHPKPTAVPTILFLSGSRWPREPANYRLG